MPKANWERLQLETASNVIYDLESQTDKKYKCAFIFDDSLYARTGGKGTELCSKVFDYKDHKWEHYFRHICNRYNDTHEDLLPKITPHVCRHTFCSKMARSGMNPKILQYIMGHSGISMTMNVYTHVNCEDVAKEMARLQEKDY